MSQRMLTEAVLMALTIAMLFLFYMFSTFSVLLTLPQSSASALVAALMIAACAKAV